MLNKTEAAIQQVERLLSAPESAPQATIPPALHTRIMADLRDAQPERAPRRSIGPWAVVMAAGLVLAIGAATMLWQKPAPAPVPGGDGSLVSVPLAPAGMIRLVADTVDGPLREQADRIMSDTRRATRAIVRRVPFTGRGG